MACVEAAKNFYPKFGQQCTPNGEDDPTAGALGWIASASCIGLFMSPIPQVIMKVVKSKTTGQFPDTPYLVSLVNCALWVMYAIPKRLIQCFAINALGAVLNIAWIGVFVAYTENKRNLLLKIVAVCVVIGAVFATQLGLGWDSTTATGVTGDVADIFNIGMYGAPLAAVGTVVATRSVETLPILMVIGCLFASILWGTYAKWIGDYHVGIPNDIGVMLALVQIIVWLKYRNATPIDAARDKLIDGGAKVADETQA